MKRVRCCTNLYALDPDKPNKKKKKITALNRKKKKEKQNIQNNYLIQKITLGYFCLSGLRHRIFPKPVLWHKTLPLFFDFFIF